VAWRKRAPRRTRASAAGDPNGPRPPDQKHFFALRPARRFSPRGRWHARPLRPAGLTLGLGYRDVVRLFDSTFVLGSVLVLLALGIAVAAAMRADLPLVGTGVGALIAVAVIGMAGCAVGGISQAPAAGWTNPAVVAGIVLGVVALVVTAAGVFGWSGVLQPVAQLIPGQAESVAPARPAIVALGAVIALKWLIATVMAARAS
jgi:hypothetical protein